MRAPLNVRTLILALLLSMAPAASFAGVFVSITVAPPALPVYTQPVCPGDGYLWTPGYWGYAPAGYYWVPGVWVRAPRPGLLWTPGYWGFGGGFYAWHAGYWGPHVGFYGGVNYGYGYGGVGFFGGRWEGGHFAYNTAVLHVNTTIVHNTYVDRTVIRNTTIVNRTSYNGPGGINARASHEEMAAQREQHFGATSEQMSHEHTAGFTRNNFASVNGGRPGTPAMSRPASVNNNRQGNFNNRQASFNNRPAPANGGNYHPSGNQGGRAYNNNNGGHQNYQQPHQNQNRPEGNHGGERR